MSRKLEHIVGDVFRDSEGKIVKAELLTKDPILVRVMGHYEGTDFVDCYVNYHWNGCINLHKDAKGANGYTLSGMTCIIEGNEELFAGERMADKIIFAINLYKTRQE